MAGAVCCPGCGGSFGNARRRDVLECLVFRACVPAGCAPAGCSGGVAGADSGRVLRLLREGRVAEALEAYSTPLLSRSGVLAVQLLRDQLDLAVGPAVRSAGDSGLLIRWLSRDIGAADSEAVEDLGRLVGRGDARYLSFRTKTLWINTA